jgi:ubiquinone/menaquinone biosynthesis C-methylase UbiE
VDEEPRMIDVARSRAPRDVELKVAGAAAVPFGDGSFERAVARLVVHLVDRPRVFAEIRRVLVPHGVLAIATFDPASFTDSWLDPFFPSIAAIDNVRFPTAEALSDELDGCGFDARIVRLDQTATFDRAKALEKILGKHIGTFDLIDEDEYRAGLARAERELPERVDTTLSWLVAVATSR